MEGQRILSRETWARGLIGMSKRLRVRSKQLLAHGSLFTYSLFLLFIAYCLLSLLAISAPASADTMEPEWVARYNGPGGFSAAAMVMDGSGSVYVTGSFSDGITPHTDYATIKYDSDGHQLWMVRYDGPESKGDSATTIAIDNNGNVYVTGYSWGEGFITEYATVKYDTDGNQLWVARYRYKSPGQDSRANAIAVDNDSNIYVTGTSYGSNGYPDYATVKYNSEGHQLWVARYKGADQSFDYPKAMALDNAGNVYVTGESGIVGSNGSDYATVKYDSEGHQLWVAPYPPEATARAIATDHSGNAYVIGGGSYTVSYTVKYNNQGKEVWVVPYNSPGTDPTYYHKAIAIDNKGYIYVTGSSPYTLLKYWPGVEGAEVKNFLNQVSFHQGDTLTWDVDMKGNGRVDVYLAVVLPSGDFICLADTLGNTSAYNTPLPILRDWSILPGNYRIIYYPFNGKEPKGEYQLYIILTRPRANPSDRSKWLVYDAFSFIVP